MLRWEGCLSIPGLRAAVPRAPRIRYRGVDLDGRPVEREVAGFHAGVVQHEYDHLDGILYPMRMTDFRLFGFTEEMARAAERGGRPGVIAPPERSAERDAAIAAMLAHVPFDGWTRIALRRGLAAIGGDPRDAALLFPGGAADMIEAFCDLADRRMAAGIDGAGLCRSAHHRARARGDRAAAGAEPSAPGSDPPRAGGAGAAGQRAVAAACTARTVDAIWHAAGDRAADFSWYTKRALLAAVYTATLLFWLRRDDQDATTPRRLRSWTGAWPGWGGSAACVDGRSRGSAACCPRRCAAFELTKARPGNFASWTPTEDSPLTLLPSDSAVDRARPPRSDRCQHDRGGPCGSVISTTSGWGL